MSATSTSFNDHSRLTDSPWYWVYLFSTAGLIALILVGPKFAFRQSQIERSAQGRQRAAQNMSGSEPTTQMSTVESTHIVLRPLYFVLGGILACAWLNLSWRHFRRRRAVREQLPVPVDSNSPR
jgi:hypothetical protein